MFRGLFAMRAPTQFRRLSRVPNGLRLTALLSLVPLATVAKDTPPLSPLRAVIVGGGPDMANNQVAIESNVRYVGRLLPTEAVRTTLFCDGDLRHATVLYDDEVRYSSEGERLLAAVLNGPEEGGEDTGHYRKPQLGAPLDGAARRVDLQRVFEQLRSETMPAHAPRSLLLYFTGHGSRSDADIENNVFDLWGKSEKLSVKELAAHLATLPAEAPVNIVMVQCYSGAFGNLIFDGGDPRRGVVDRDIAGFFATVKERVAAGCTSAVNESEYHDFTSYFFAALTGRDRVGRKISGADYNRDGRIGMDEAFCYALIHDESIDVPVCTSDVFLRRFVQHRDAEVVETPFRQVRAWARPAQRAALDALSSRLRLSGENRLGQAYRQMLDTERGPEENLAYRTLRRNYMRTNRQSKEAVMARWPALKNSTGADYEAARKEAVAWVNRHLKESPWSELSAAEDSLDKSVRAREAQEIAASRLIRFVRLSKSVVLAHRLETGDDSIVKARFARLVAAETRSLLPPVGSLPRTTQMDPFSPSDRCREGKSNVSPLSAARSRPCACRQRRLHRLFGASAGNAWSSDI